MSKPVTTPMPWYRFYSEILRDPKFKRIWKKNTQSSKMEVVGIWASLLSIASECTYQRGYLYIAEDMPYSDDDLSEEFGMEKSKLLAVLDEFVEQNMLSRSDDGCYFIRNWDKRQYKSDNVYQRVIAHREKVAEKQEENKSPEKGEKPKKPEKKVYEIGKDGLPTWMPQILKPYAAAFINASGVKLSTEIDRDWLKALNEIKDIENIQPADVEAAVEKLRKKNMIVSRPGSVIRTLKDMAGKQAGKEILLDADGNEVRI